MAIENITNSSDRLVDVISGLGSIGRWIQAIGLFIVLWIVFQLIVLWFNTKRMKEVYRIKEDMKRIESKIDRILRKTK